MGKPRILYITPQLPYFPGGHGGMIREYNLLTKLCGKYEFSLVALAPTTYERVTAMNAAGITVKHAYAPDSPKRRDWRGSTLRILKFLRSPIFYFKHIYKQLYPRRSVAPLPSYQGFANVFVKNCMPRLSLRDYDLVHIEHTYLLPILSHLKEDNDCPPVVVAAENIESRLSKRIHDLGIKYGNNSLETKEVVDELAAIENKLLPLADCVVTMSENDLSWFVENVPLGDKPIVSVPNGVDCEYFGALEKDPGLNTLTFTGTLGYAPNYHALFWFRENVLPSLVMEIPNIRLIVAGASKKMPKKLLETIDSKHEEYYLDVPDIRPFIQRGSIFVVPLHAGSGTRLKILEAMASGRPVVSTRLGAEGIPAENGKTIVLADSAEEMTYGILQLLRDPDRARGMGIASRKWVQENFDWQNIANQQEAVYDRMLRA